MLTYSDCAVVVDPHPQHLEPTCPPFTCPPTLTRSPTHSSLQVLTYGDCAVVVDPKAEELAEVAICSGGLELFCFS